MPRGFATLLVGVLLTGSLRAHHATSAVFDLSTPMVVKGTLTKIDWVNPHIALILDARAADGSTEVWKIESQPPSWFRHVGLTRADFAKAMGQMITIGGARARDGSRYAYLQKLTFADGSSFELDRTPGGGATP
jgi:hypothetical protein